MDKNSKNIGTVTQIIGPVLDIRFEEGHLPELNNAVTIDYDSRHIVLEVAQHIGDSVVRCEGDPAPGIYGAAGRTGRTPGAAAVMKGRLWI